jgi:hypothetical protein
VNVRLRQSKKIQVMLRIMVKAKEMKIMARINQPIEIIMLLSVISVKPNSTTIVANNFLGLLTKNMEIFVLLA